MPLHTHAICGSQLVTDLQLIPLNTLFPPQFISVLKVLRYLIVPKNSSTLQLNLPSASVSSLCCHCQIAPSLCWCGKQQGSPALITSAYPISCVSIIVNGEQYKPSCWVYDTLGAWRSVQRKSGQGSGKPPNQNNSFNVRLLTIYTTINIK